jgi:hypothetical protein
MEVKGREHTSMGGGSMLEEMNDQTVMVAAHSLGGGMKLLSWRGWSVAVQRVEGVVARWCVGEWSEDHSD